MAEDRVFTVSQVAQHKSKQSCWLVINGRVLDVTKYLDDHPGGEEVLLEVAGKDATKNFKDVGHSKEAQNLLLKYQVGVLQGHTVEKYSVNDTRGKQKQEMSAFVIKDDKSAKYSALIDFVVPLLVAGVYFAYRCLA